MAHPVARKFTSGQDLRRLVSRRIGAFTGCQPNWFKIALEMVVWMGVGPARALALGLMAAVLTACASTPAPIAAGGSVRPAPREALPRWEGAEEPRVADAGAGLQCVPYARQLSGVSIYGDANTWWRQAAGRYPRSSRPAPGSVLVLQGYNTTARGHVAVVTHIDSDRLLRVDHANWLNNGEISVGVPVLDVSPDNDWSEIRVWHIPGGHWGGRIYQAQGFIHPFSLQAALS
jgi:hypothetical protein